MHKQRIAVLVAAGAGALATFMPWINAPIVGSIPGSAGDGWFTFVFFVIVGICAAVGARAEAMTKGVALSVVGAGALTVFFGAWKIVDFRARMADVGSDNIIARAISESVSIGFGLYLVVLAGIAVVALAFALRAASPAAAGG